MVSGISRSNAPAGWFCQQDFFINIDAEKKKLCRHKSQLLFHRAFTKTDLCEYYVNLEANTFDTFKVEPLMTVFEQSPSWDELIRHFVDSML